VAERGGGCWACGPSDAGSGREGARRPQGSAKRSAVMTVPQRRTAALRPFAVSSASRTERCKRVGATRRLTPPLLRHGDRQLGDSRRGIRVRGLGRPHRGSPVSRNCVTTHRRRQGCVFRDRLSTRCAGWGGPLHINNGFLYMQQAGDCGRFHVGHRMDGIAAGRITMRISSAS